MYFRFGDLDKMTTTKTKNCQISELKKKIDSCEYLCLLLSKYNEFIWKHIILDGNILVWDHDDFKRDEIKVFDAKLEAACAVLGLEVKDVLTQNFTDGLSWRNKILEELGRFLPDERKIKSRFEPFEAPGLFDDMRNERPLMVEEFELIQKDEQINLFLNGKIFGKKLHGFLNVPEGYLVSRFEAFDVLSSNEIRRFNRFKYAVIGLGSRRLHEISGWIIDLKSDWVFNGSHIKEIHVNDYIKFKLISNDGVIHEVGMQEIPYDAFRNIEYQIRGSTITVKIENFMVIHEDYDPGSLEKIGYGASVLTSSEQFLEKIWVEMSRKLQQEKLSDRKPNRYETIAIRA